MEAIAAIASLAIASVAAFMAAFVITSMASEDKVVAAGTLEK